MSKKYAALYIRVSTEAQREEGYSIDAQRDMLLGFCKSKKIENSCFYIDGGFSGANIERPYLRQMIEDIRANKISHVIVYKLDRLSRSQKDTLYLIEDVLIPNSVAFVSLNENMDTSTPIGRAMLGIMSAFAQLERETIKERTRMGMRERVKSGLWMGGGRIPFGYDYDSQKGILVPNEDAETVRQIYELYLSGYSTLKISEMLGLKYERLAIQILKRKTNIGSIVYNGEEFKNCHEAIISEEIYNKSMDMMKRRSRNKTYPSKNLLTGLLYCGKCGSKMRYQKWSNGEYKIYCYSKDSSKKHLSTGIPCDSKAIWAKEIEDTVLSDIFNMKYKLEKNEKENFKDTVSALENTLLSKQKKLKKLYELYADSEDDILMETISERKNEIKNLQNQIGDEKKLIEKAGTVNETLAKINDIERAWDTLTPREKQNIMRELVDKIVIKNNEADIYYSEYIK